VVPLFGVGTNFDALAYAAPDLGYGPDLFYAISNVNNDISVLCTISPSGAVVSRFPLRSGFNALTFAAPDLGYGSNLFYAILTEPPTSGNSTLYTISASGTATARFNLGTGFVALAFAAPDLGYGGPNLLYAIATDFFGTDASTFLHYLDRRHRHPPRAVSERS